MRRRAKASRKTNRGEKSKSLSTENDSKSGKDMKAEGREGPKDNMNAEKKGTETKSQTTTESQTGRTQTGHDRQTSQSAVTTGQAGAAAKLSTEQRTRITSVIREEHVTPVNNIDFSISVGSRVPREGISLRALPSEIVTIYPDWRGYEFFLFREQIVVVDPRTFEIVAVLEA